MGRLCLCRSPHGQGPRLLCVCSLVYSGSTSGLIRASCQRGHGKSAGPSSVGPQVSSRWGRGYFPGCCVSGSFLPGFLCFRVLSFFFPRLLRLVSGRSGWTLRGRAHGSSRFVACNPRSAGFYRVVLLRVALAALLLVESNPFCARGSPSRGTCRCRRSSPPVSRLRLGGAFFELGDCVLSRG